MNVSIRWMIRRDMPRVLKIERATFDPPWTEEDFCCFLRQRNAIGMVAEVDNRVVGFVCYELCTSSIEIINLAVDPPYRRNGVASRLIRRLCEKLSKNRRKEIRTTARESNLDAQLFFRSQGFICSDVVAGAYSDPYDDGYQFVFRAGWAALKPTEAA